MENNPFGAILFLIIVIAIFLFRGYWNSPERKGREGEIRVEGKLQWMTLVGKPGKILNNLYIPNGGNNTAEIDVLYITVKGLFVIESKNYAGYIFGNDNYKNWTVTLYAGKDWLGFKKTEKHHFYNPVWQNKTHIRALKNYLDQDIQCISLIVFSDRGDMKKVTVDSPNTTVCYQHELPKVVSHYWSCLPDVISEAEVDRIYSMLYPLTMVSEEQKHAHVRQITNRKTTAQAKPVADASKDLKCPWCGGKLVVRTAKHGPNAGEQFYGCSNFPNCRFTKNIR